MKLLCGDELGYLRIVEIESKKQTVFGDPSRENGIERMQWCGKTDKESEVLLALHNGSIIVRKSNEDSIITTFPYVEGIPKGLGVIPGKTRKAIVTTDDGVTTILPWKCKETETVFSVCDEKTQSKKIIKTMELCPSLSFISVGGNEFDLELFNLETQKSIWKAKNLPHDKLDMRVPVWVNCQSYLSSEESNCKIVVGTGYHEVRLYDTKAQRRPIFNIEVGNLPFQSICLSNDGKYAILGNTQGGVFKFDLNMRKSVSSYLGSTGSVRSINCHPILPYIALTGLDQYVRVYDVNNRNDYRKYYVKQKSNCVLWTSEDVIVEKTKDDEIWDKLEENKKKKRKLNE